MQHRQMNQIIRDSKPPTEPVETPWTGGEELKYFWALANNVFGREHASARVYDIIGYRFKKAKLHEISRSDFLDLLVEFRLAASGEGELEKVLKKLGEQGGKIRWLQRRLAWTDYHLVKYILWHGKKTDRKIDNINWLIGSDKARGIITGMSIILKNGGTKNGRTK